VWKRFNGIDPEGNPIELSLNRDKSPADSKKEVLSKKLGAIFAQMYPGLPISTNKRDGTISCRWVPVARIVVSGPSEAKVQFVPRKVEEHSIDKVAVQNAFASAAGTVTEEEWCS
jgi:hypothetical protein